jgi:hypothetical protein
MEKLTKEQTQKETAKYEYYKEIQELKSGESLKIKTAEWPRKAMPNAYYYRIKNIVCVKRSGDVYYIIKK